MLTDNLDKVLSAATLLYSKSEIETALDKMAVELSFAVAKKSPLFLCVLIGGMVPMGNLLPRLNFPLEVDYIHATRYTGKFTGDTELVWRAKPKASLKDRTIVIVDDILDEGLTLAALHKYCQDEGAKEILTAVLLEKDKARSQDGWQKADFHGLRSKDEFVFGYGLDYKGYLRNAPGIYAVNDKHKK